MTDDGRNDHSPNDHGRGGNEPAAFHRVAFQSVPAACRTPIRANKK